MEPSSETQLRKRLSWRWKEPSSPLSRPREDARASVVMRSSVACPERCRPRHDPATRDDPLLSVRQTGDGEPLLSVADRRRRAAVADPRPRHHRGHLGRRRARAGALTARGDARPAGLRALGARRPRLCASGRVRPPGPRAGRARCHGPVGRGRAFARRSGGVDARGFSAPARAEADPRGARGPAASEAGAPAAARGTVHRRRRRWFAARRRAAPLTDLRWGRRLLLALAVADGAELSPGQARIMVTASAGSSRLGAALAEIAQADLRPLLRRTSGAARADLGGA